MSEEKKLTDKLEEMYVSGKFNGEIIFNAIKTIYALQEKNAKQKAEIERLHKVLQEEFVSLKAVNIAQNSPKAMKMLVESVGCVQKDTANEIYDFAKEFYSSNEDIFGERLKDFVKRYGVEVK